MRNYCKLVPRTPPEGFLDWCREKSRTRDEGEDQLDIHGLVFEAEWVEEEGIAPMLEERKPRKIKMVHIRCTACGEERWVNWEGRTTALGKPDYGFLSIRENGCERYFKYNKDLLLDHRKAALQQELAAEQRRHGSV